MVSMTVELTVIMVLTSLDTALEVVMKYVSLAVTANVPRFYYNSLVDHKLLLTTPVVLEFTNRRHSSIQRSCLGNFYRCIQKSIRVFYCSWAYYFMPFSALGLTYLYTEKTRRLGEAGKA